MKRKRRTEITVETERVVVIRQNRSVIQAWCAVCAQHVMMLPAEEAAAAVGMTRRTIYHWAEAGKIHFTETSDSALLVCLNSLTTVMSDKRSVQGGSGPSLLTCHTSPSDGGEAVSRETNSTEVKPGDG